MESFKRRSSNLYKNPLSPQAHGHQTHFNFGEIAKKNQTPVRKPKNNELLTSGLGDYETGVDKAPKVAALLGQTSQGLKKQILNRIQNENIRKVHERRDIEDKER